MSPSGDLMTALAWSLLHFFWQGAAIAALAAVAMALFRESTTRYFIGVSALALMCVSFGMTFALLDGPPAGGTEVAAATSALSSDVAPAPAPGTVTLLDRPATAGPDFAWVARAWLAGVCLLALRVAGGLLLLERLRRRSLLALPLEIVERCLALQQRLGISRVVGYCECRFVSVPSVIGFLRPIVLLPARALTGLSGEQLEAVIAHELGHIKRFDVAVNFLQVVVETLFFFHPAVWWLNKRIRADREECCDDVAIAACARKLDYARALAIMEDWGSTPELSMAATGCDVSSRVARLLGMSRQHAGARSAGVLTAALVLAAALIAGAASIGIAGPTPATPHLAALQLVVAQVDTPLAQAGSENRSRADAARTPASTVTFAAKGGSWTLTPAEHAGKLRFTFIQRHERVTSQSGSDWPVTAFQGLDPATRVRHDVTFTIARDAGRFDCEGDLTDGEGAGTFRYTPDPTFVRGMSDLGFGGIDGDEQFAMAMYDVSLEFARQMRSENLAKMDPGKLVAFRIFGVSQQFIREMREAGVTVTDADELVRLRLHGIAPATVRELRRAGIDVDEDLLIRFKIHGVSPEFVAQLESLGYANVEPDELVAMRIHGATPEYVSDLKSRGVNDLTVDKLIALRMQGVD